MRASVQLERNGLVHFTVTRFDPFNKLAPTVDIIDWYHVVVCVLDLHFTLELPWLGRNGKAYFTVPIDATFSKLTPTVYLYMIYWCHVLVCVLDLHFTLHWPRHKMAIAGPLWWFPSQQCLYYWNEEQSLVLIWLIMVKNAKVVYMLHTNLYYYLDCHDRLNWIYYLTSILSKSEPVLLTGLHFQECINFEQLINSYTCTHQHKLCTIYSIRGCKG